MPGSRSASRLRFVRKAVRRFMPGEDADSAFAAAATLAASGQGFVHAPRREPRRHRGGRRGRSPLPRDPGPEHDPCPPDRALGEAHAAGPRHRRGGLLRAHVRLVARPGRHRHTWRRVDMEGSAYVERTVALYERLKAAHRNVGICLQAYLRRTPAADLQRLLPLGARGSPGEGCLRRAGRDRLAAPPGGGRRVPGGGSRPRGRCR